ncbi:hypothetical protein pEaSNUABM39_00061 [Erwinia phage pEa_SNUABM_39]|nr:hypothetical protein pEaSNUABM39_00061 [Erwinia phage pEa_SNUABM_39]
MAMTQLQYALGQLAKASSEASQAALTCQQFGFDHVYPNDPLAMTARDRLKDSLRGVDAATRFVEREAGAGFEFVSSTLRSLNGMDQLRSQMGYAIEAGQVEGYDEEDEDE